MARIGRHLVTTADGLLSLGINTQGMAGLRDETTGERVILGNQKSDIDELLVLLGRLREELPE